MWQFPQGGVEEGSSLEDNVLRELKEELGISRKKVGKLVKLQATHKYDFAKVPDYAVGRWRGQAQTFWLVEFLGSDSDIDLTAHDEEEFSDWRWCTPEEVRQLAEARRLPGYVKPLEEFEEMVSR